LANDSCKAGKVKVADLKAKPSREVAPGDIVTVKKGGMKLRLKVVSTVEKRVGAKTVSEYLEDLTPEEDYVTAREHREAMPKFNRSSSAPRPTRKERQAWEDFFAKVNE
jgi:ribosome-associated heat shock protein Hsp15